MNPRTTGAIAYLRLRFSTRCRRPSHHDPECRWGLPCRPCPCRGTCGRRAPCTSRASRSSSAGKTARPPLSISPRGPRGVFGSRMTARGRGGANRSAGSVRVRRRSRGTSPASFVLTPVATTCLAAVCRRGSCLCGSAGTILRACVSQRYAGAEQSGGRTIVQCLTPRPLLGDPGAACEVSC